MHKHDSYNSIYSGNDSESKKPNYLLRRIGAVVTAFSLGLGAYIGIKEGSQFIIDRNVNVEVPEDVLNVIKSKDFSDEELRVDFGVERIVVERGDAISIISDKYIERYDLRLDISDVNQVLINQNGGTELIMPDDEFYLPIHEDKQ